MYRYLTKLLLAGVVAAILAVGPANAFHKGVVHGSGGEEIQTLDSLACAAEQIAKWDGSEWVCADVLDGTEPKTVFVTLETFTGDLKTQGGALTGLRGGDNICQAAAENGIVPPGTYIAWLSTNDKDAIDRLPDGAAGYFLPSGIKVADDKADLVTCSGGVCLDHEIVEDENGNVRRFIAVWTGTNTAGTSEGSHCNAWTNSASDGSVFGRNGNTDFKESAWTDLFDFTCDAELHLYCFQR